MEKKIIMLLAPQNFRDEEYLIPKEIFEKNGIKVYSVSKGVKIATGKFNTKVKIDYDICDIDSLDFDGIILVGGMGSLDYKKEPVIAKLLYDFFTEDKLIAAICIAPLILAQNRILRGKRATVWNDPGSNEQINFLEEKEAIYVNNENVVIDDNIITANGVEVAEDFALKIVDFFQKN